MQRKWENIQKKPKFLTVQPGESTKKGLFFCLILALLCKTITIWRFSSFVCAEFELKNYLFYYVNNDPELVLNVIFLNMGFTIYYYFHFNNNIKYELLDSE